MIDTTYRGHRPRSTSELRAWHRKSQMVHAVEPELPIVDCHHHVYGSEADPHHYRLENLQEDLDGGHRILGTIYVEAYEFGWRADGPERLRSVGEVDEVVRLTARPIQTSCGLCTAAAGIVSHVNMTRGTDVAEVLEHHVRAGQGRLRGVRHRAATDDWTVGRFMGERPKPQLLRQRPFQQAVSMLSEHDLVFDAWVYCTQLEDVIHLADASPSTTIVLDHAGGLLGVAEHAGRRSELLDLWRSRLLDLSRRDNVRVKIGGLGTVECGFGFEQQELPACAAQLVQAWRPVIDTCLHAFGARRCMLESNFPVDKQSCSYTELWNAFKFVTADLSRDERLDLFYRTASVTYRLPALEIAGDLWRSRRPGLGN